MKKRVLFLCSGNSARSQMAEALMRSEYGNEYEVFSAGTHPQAVNPQAIAALDAAGIATEALKAKSTSAFSGQAFDFLITLCDKAKQECAPFPDVGEAIAWDFVSPAELDGEQPFTRTLQLLAERIRMFVLVQAKRSEGSALQPVELFKSLADPTRLATIMLLQNQRELCVCELMEALQEIQPKISRNLALLKKSGLLADRRQGQWVFYQLNPALPAWASDVIKLTAQNNLHLIAGSLQLLEAMADRPERCLGSICG